METLDLVEFIDTWLKRAKREKEYIDDGDRFVSLWIAFNAWLKSEYSENKPDKELIKEVKKNSELKSLFIKLKNEKSFSEALGRISNRRVYDARCPKNRDKIKEYNGSFESLIDVLYQIRCNLFHGRKNINKLEEFILVGEAKNILLPLFSEYWEKFINTR